MANAALVRRVSKSKFSMYLRTDCDKALYLSLFSNNPFELAKNHIPVPLKSRPGVQLITQSGREFEYEQFDYLISVLPNNVIHKSNGRAEIDLLATLNSVNAPQFVLQPAIEPEDFRQFFLQNIGVSTSNSSLIPPMSGLRPDVIFVDVKQSGEYEILPDGTRKAVSKEDTRRPLCVIDLKNVSEANATYSAEVCLYAVFLSNWLHSVGAQYKDAYFISDRIYLWRHMELPHLAAIMKLAAGGDHLRRLAELRKDLADGAVDYILYMPNVRKFFVEDLPRVISKGDSHGWAALDYHVSSRCSACDWLGNRTWLSDDDKAYFDANPNDYCYPRADATDHLSKISNLSKGATNVLSQGGHSTVAQLTTIAADAPVLKGHSLLKKDRRNIRERAVSLTNGTTSVQTHKKVAGLAKNLDAEYDIVVNFDAGSGLLTGIGLRGAIFAPYGTTFTDTTGKASGLLNLGSVDFVVGKDSLVAEGAALTAFIEKLAEFIGVAETQLAAKGVNSVHTQVCFWELRQYEELCNAFGRHLLDILNFSDKYQRALAWLFPAEELLEKDEEIAPSIVFVKDVVSRHILMPQKFTQTLLGTVEHYHLPSLPPPNIDNYYREPLGDAIPRERIFEIWKSTTGTVRLYGKAVPIADAIQRYGQVLRLHTRALASLTAQLRKDLKPSLSGKAPALKMSIPTGLSGVAYDSKLWDRWSRISNATDKTEHEHELLVPAEELEAAYKALVLTNVVKTISPNTYEFEVSEESTEAKIEPGGYYTIGIVDWPGFPMQTAVTLGLSGSGSDYSAMHAVIHADLQSFDRVARRATVQFRPKWGGVTAVFDAVMAANIVPIGTGGLYLLEGLPYDDSKVTTDLLRKIGNPTNATVSKEAVTAMGSSAAKKIPVGTDSDCPVSRVLWSAKALSTNVVRNDADVAALTKFAGTANEHPLNPSQVEAVSACATGQLSIIWGPPGTGKTDTLVAFLHAVIREGRQRRILISGPNYRTVEEIFFRLLRNLDFDLNVNCSAFLAYSPSRTPRTVPAVGNHLNAVSLRLTASDPEYGNLMSAGGDPNQTVVVATTAHAVTRLAQDVAHNELSEIFDLVVLDESSQIPVTLALRPLATLRSNAQLIIAGDNLQMPPIHHLDPPKGAEYLVGSIQKYLTTRFGIVQQELLVNYRSNQELVDYAKSIGYPEKLAAYSPVKNLVPLSDVTILPPLPANLPASDAYSLLLDPQKQVCAFVHDDPVSSQANEVEAGIVAALAFLLRNSIARELSNDNGGSPTAYTDHEFFESGVGIVTPHKAQKALVIKKLADQFPNADPQSIFDAVDTVERFQGGERNTILVSFGVGDTDIIEGEEEFLLQMERTNVAVSRAKAKCIILMPKSLAYHLPSDIKAAKTSLALKTYLEEFCNNRSKATIDFGGTIRPAEVRWH